MARWQGLDNYGISLTVQGVRQAEFSGRFRIKSHRGACRPGSRSCAPWHDVLHPHYRNIEETPLHPADLKIPASAHPMPQHPLWTSPAARSCCAAWQRSEEHTSELQSLMRISYAVFCLKKKKKKHN